MRREWRILSSLVRFQWQALIDSNGVKRAFLRIGVQVALVTPNPEEKGRADILSPAPLSC